MGRRLEVGRQENNEELKRWYQEETHPQRRTRLQALRHLSQGKRIEDVVEITGASYRSVQQWLSWYRQGGLTEVMKRVVGHHAKGKKPYLTFLEQRALVAKVQLGEFRTVWDVMEWVRARWGVSYTYQGMYTLMKGHGLGLKIPDPILSKPMPSSRVPGKRGAVECLGPSGNHQGLPTMALR